MFKCMEWTNFYGGWGDRAHIEWIKDNGLHTQAQGGNFNQQVKEMICKGVLLNKAEDALMSQLQEKMHL